MTSQAMKSAVYNLVVIWICYLCLPTYGQADVAFQNTIFQFLKRQDIHPLLLRRDCRNTIEPGHSTFRSLFISSKSGEPYVSDAIHAICAQLKF